jgi:signal transduction histidine kinase
MCSCAKHEPRERRERERAELLMAIVGHDLRSPLAAMRLSAAQLLDTLTSERERQAAHRIVRSADWMARTIDEVLDFTRIRAEKGLPCHPAETDIAGILMRVRDDFGAKKERISVDFEGDTIGVWDGDRLAQVFSNLLCNAIQHSPKDAIVCVRIDARASDRIEVTVHNSGVIPPKILPDIFEPFRHAPSSRGLGLGLFITKAIVLSHGGTIDATSSEEGGTRLTFVLPRDPTAAPRSGARR